LSLSIQTKIRSLQGHHPPRPEVERDGGGLCGDAPRAEKSKGKRGLGGRWGGEKARRKKKQEKGNSLRDHLLLPVGARKSDYDPHLSAISVPPLSAMANMREKKKEGDGEVGLGYSKYLDRLKLCFPFLFLIFFSFFFFRTVSSRRIVSLFMWQKPCHFP
jgi:hypothetical protein